MNLIGRIYDSFNFLSVIGQGGMGVVYKSYDYKLERYVAIKVIHPRVSQSKVSIQRFKREARNQAKLLHPNIIAVLDLIKLDDSFGIVMEYAEGESLSNLLKKNIRLDFPQTKDILNQIIAGLSFAHSNGFIHRDIKPSNIIVRNDGVVKIADFGIAKSVSDRKALVTASNFLGTTFYMSPEQINGLHLSHHTDIYSLGCTIYEMVTGYPPFYYSNDFQVLNAHLREIHAPIENWRQDIPHNFSGLVNLMLQKSHKERPKSCEVIAKQLDSIQPVNYYDMYLLPNKSKRNEKKSASSYLLIKIFLLLVTILVSYLVIKNIKITGWDNKEVPKKELNPFNKL